MLSAECLVLRGPHPQPLRPVHEAVHMPPFMPAAAGGLSGRPRCRIFPVGRLWVLQMEPASAWFVGEGPVGPPPRLEFPTLAAAVAHAKKCGYDYRIITPSPVACIADRGRRLPSRSDTRAAARWGRGQNLSEH
jgi:hypothetical protein